MSTNPEIISNDLSTKEGKTKLEKQLKTVLTKAELLTNETEKILFSKEAMDNYWIPAFTHDSITQRTGYNYQSLEAIGDVVAESGFYDYIRKLYKSPDGKIGLTESQFTLLKQIYLSETYQTKVGFNLGFDNLIYFSEDIKDIGTKILEDVFESFFGALFSLVSDTTNSPHAHSYVFNMLHFILKDEDINAYENITDAVTQVKEIWEDAMRKKSSYFDYPVSDANPVAEAVVKLYDNENDQIRKRNVVQTFKIKSNTLDVKQRKLAVASKVLEYFKDKGINYNQENNNKNIRESQNNSGIGRALKETFLAIDVINKDIDEFKIVMFEAKATLINKETDEKEFSGYLRFGYANNTKFENVKWNRAPYSFIGSSITDARIGVMKQFYSSV